MTKEPSALALRLKEAREKAGVPQRALSNAAGVTPSVVWHIESGSIQDVSANLCASFAELLDVPLLWLICGQGESPDWTRTATRGEVIRQLAAEYEAQKKNEKAAEEAGAA